MSTDSAAAAAAAADFAAPAAQPIQRQRSDKRPASAPLITGGPTATESSGRPTSAYLASSDAGVIEDCASLMAASDSVSLLENSGRPTSEALAGSASDAGQDGVRLLREEASIVAPCAARVGIAGVRVEGEEFCEGLSGIVAASRTPHGGSCSQLSLRSDWDSDDFSPDVHRATSATTTLPTPIAEEAGSANTQTAMDLLRESSLPGYASALRSGRRTLTKLYCPTPISYGVHSIQNLRREMEDAHKAVLGVEPGSGLGAPSASASSTSPPLEETAAIDDLVGDEAHANLGSFSFFGVFDGHGGARAAEYAGEHMFKILCRDKDTLSADPSKALYTAFAALESEWLSVARKNEWMDGSTAAVALVDRRGGQCIVGNVGDSEVLLGTRLDNDETHLTVLTEVHHLKRNEQEAERVRTVGGRLWHSRLGHPTISPQVLSLSVSRAIGDLFFKDETYTQGKASGLVADPFLTTVEVCTEGIVEQFLLLGCDGLWDTVTYKQACQFVFSSLKEGKAAKVICEGLTKLASTSGSSDNITVMLAVLCGGESAADGKQPLAGAGANDEKPPVDRLEESV